MSYLTKKWVDRSKLGGTELGGTEHGGAEHGGTEHGGAEHGGADMVMRRINRIILCNLLDSLKILWRRELRTIHELVW